MIQTTWQRVAPSGPEWAPKFDKGALPGNLSNILVMNLLLNRAITLYWQRRPSVPGMSDVEGSVAV